MCSEPLCSRGGFRSALALAAFLIPVCAALAAAQPPYLVADLNTRPVNGSALPWQYDHLGPLKVEMGGVLYFAAADPMHGEELWRSDGTPEGTRLVRDIRPGRSDSRVAALTVHQGRLYFYADDGVWGQELWSSDGSREGTRLVRDLCPGSCWGASDFFMASAGNQLFFAAGRFQDPDLWRTDGTREGTRRVLDSCPGCSNQLGDLTPLPDGRLLFTANDPQNGWELWVSDGAPEGTRSLDLTPGPRHSGPTHLVLLGDRILFWTYDFPSGLYDLWSSDGTLAGSRVVRSGILRPDHEGGPVVWEGSVYFATSLGELWRTDGTAGGTVLLKTFDTRQTPSLRIPYRPTRLAALPSGVLFIAGDSAWGLALWRTRGTEATTQPLKDPVDGPDSPDLIALHRVGSRAFFFAVSAEGGIDLWVSDGNSQTRRVAPLCRGAQECFPPDRFGDELVSAGGTLFFPVHSKSVGRELWRSDGSAEGTFQVRDIYSGPGPAVLSEVAALNGRALFAAWTSSTEPAALWRSDGTAAGTARVSEAPWAQDFLRQGDHLYFSGALPWSFSEPFFLRRQGLWRTDGTPAGTEQIASDLFRLDLLAFDRGLLYLGAGDHESVSEGTGVELWRSDGTLQGTRQVADLDREWVNVDYVTPPYVESGSSDPGVPVRLGSALLFAADDGLSGRELWATDGTEAGTRKVRDIHPQPDRYGEPGASDPAFLVRLGQVVLFVADDGLSGRELWVTDGTEAGTRLLRDLRPGAEGSRPHDLVKLGRKVYFFASAGGSGEALWQTDGTEGGTVQVKSLARRGLPSWGRDLKTAGGRLFFVADNEATGPELHVSNGTAAGTRLLQIRPGANGSCPQSLTAVGGVLVFAADDGAHGLEPWRSDGTKAGTYRLGDLAPGPDASSPSAFTAAGPLLFFAADDGVHGRELWAMGWPR